MDPVAEVNCGFVAGCLDDIVPIVRAGLDEGLDLFPADPVDRDADSWSRAHRPNFAISIDMAEGRRGAGPKVHSGLWAILPRITVRGAPGVHRSWSSSHRTHGYAEGLSLAQPAGSPAVAM